MNDHIPVLLEEVLEYLAPKPNQNFIDATIGGGGHTAAILEKNSPRGKVLGIEIDSGLYQKLKSSKAEFSIFPPKADPPLADNFQFSKRLTLVNDSFVNLKKIVERHNFHPVHGILFDLGMSSRQLEKSGKGFSFLRDEPLDMRFSENNFQFSPTKSRVLDKVGTISNFQTNSKFKIQNSKFLTAADIVNKWPMGEIEEILSEYGEERFAKKIAEQIIKERKNRPIKTTFQLVEIIKKATPGWYKRGRIHPATRTFQALRIAVNDELNNIKKALPQALEILEPGGRIVVISFHSLEDRIVKHFFRDCGRIERAISGAVQLDHRRDAVTDCGRNGALKILTKKPITPQDEEIKINPRSRSAKLRAAIKITNHKSRHEIGIPIFLFFI